MGILALRQRLEMQEWKKRRTTFYVIQFLWSSQIMKAENKSFHLPQFSFGSVLNWHQIDNINSFQWRDFLSVDLFTSWPLLVLHTVTCLLFNIGRRTRTVEETKSRFHIFYILFPKLIRIIWVVIYVHFSTYNKSHVTISKLWWTK